MKRSEAVSEIHEYLFQNYHDLQATDLLEIMENFMQPKQYVNPKAMEEFGDVIKEKGEHWGLIHYIDKYPEHHFPKGRPYQFYLKGWEPEE